MEQSSTFLDRAAALDVEIQERKKAHRIAELTESDALTEPILDAPAIAPIRRRKVIRVIEPEPIDEFRELLASRRLERSSFGRMAHRVLLTGCGARPSSPLIAALMSLDLGHMLPLYALTWGSFSNETIDIAAMTPAPVEVRKPGRQTKAPKPLKVRAEKPMRPAFTVRLPDEPFGGVKKTPSGKYLARVTARNLDNKIVYVGLGTYALAEDAARAVDTFLRSRGWGKLNFAESQEVLNVAA